MDVDFAREKMEVFNQAWEFLNDNFYDPAFHGANWSAVRETYAPLIAGAQFCGTLLTEVLPAASAADTNVAVPAALMRTIHLGQF